jgi:threonine/homoserine/homoserine lactone efflux protein
MIDLPLLTYMATMSVTPGPNNLMLAASGVNFGFRRTLPHLLGISVGVGIQLVLVAGVLAWVMAWLDGLRFQLLLAGCLYLLWLAWRQTRAGRPGHGQTARPLGFFAAALFQWVNPKAWMMVLNAAILFLPRGGGWGAALVMALMCTLVNLPCIAVWAIAGDRLRSRLHDQRALSLFNHAMALLLAATALWILVDELIPRQPAAGIF